MNNSDIKIEDDLAVRTVVIKDDLGHPDGAHTIIKFRIKESHGRIDEVLFLSSNDEVGARVKPEALKHVVNYLHAQTTSPRPEPSLSVDQHLDMLRALNIEDYDTRFLRDRIVDLVEELRTEIYSVKK